jgi:hypothetical protein
MKKLSIGLATLAAVAAPALAFIHPKAVGASEDLAASSADLHGFVHHKYGPSYGSHGMDEAAGDARDRITLWDLGVATECEVVADLDAVDLAFADMTQQFKENGLLADKQTKKEYKANRQDYAMLHAFTAAAKCVGTSSAAKVGHAQAGAPSL